MHAVSDVDVWSLLKKLKVWEFPKAKILLFLNHARIQLQKNAKGSYKMISQKVISDGRMANFSKAKKLTILPQRKYNIDVKKEGKNCNVKH